MDRETFRDIRDGLCLLLVIFIILVLGFSSCTLSLNMVGSQGKAQDMIEEEQTNQPKIDPTLTIPSSVI